MAIPPNDNALLTVADLRGPLNITSTDPADVDMIQELINRASDEIETFCGGRQLVAQDYAAQRYPGQREPHLRPRATPIDPASLITVSIDGIALTVWRSEADGDPALKDVIVGGDVPGAATFLYRARGWRGTSLYSPFPILLSYTGGFDPVPGGIKQAAVLTIQAFHRHQKGLDPYQSYPASATGGTVVMRADTIPQTAERLLAPYVFVAV